MEFILERLFFDIPIYTKIKIDESNIDEFSRLLRFFESRDIEGYNIRLRAMSTFSISKPLGNHGDYEERGGHTSVEITCKRYGDEYVYYFFWDPEEKILIKTGQFPSIADLHIGEIRKYNKLLPQDKLKEFTRAIGLSANGVGIGSFVYLRRIFEFLIKKAFDRALKEENIKESDFQKAKMDERIELLKSYLPDFLVENKGIYSILSLGIHELKEDTCLTHFDALKVGIEIILDEQLEELKKKEKIDAAKKKIQSIKSKVK